MNNEMHLLGWERGIAAISSNLAFASRAFSAIFPFVDNEAVPLTLREYQHIQDLLFSICSELKQAADCRGIHEREVKAHKCNIKRATSCIIDALSSLAKKIDDPARIEFKPRRDDENCLEIRIDCIVIGVVKSLKYGNWKVVRALPIGYSAHQEEGMAQ